MFSILIPTWNNLEYVKLCVESIQRNSAFQHEIILHINDGSDGTLEWARHSGLRYTRSSENIGIPLAVNGMAGLAQKEWIVFLNDDMYCCPGWDTVLADLIGSAPDDMIFLSSRLIEPADTNNSLVITRNFGQTAREFDEKALLRDYLIDIRDDEQGVASQPSLVSRRWWQMAGGYSVELAPGMSTDMDFLLKLWIIGFRRFTVADRSRIYHFACRSTGRIRKNHGGASFAMKWGITESEFKRLVKDSSGRSGSDALAPSAGFPRPTIGSRLKRAVYSLRGSYPLSDLLAWEPNPGRHIHGTKKTGSDE